MSVDFYVEGSDSAYRINMSNANAMAIMSACGITQDWCGTLTLAQQIFVKLNIQARLNGGNIAQFTRETVKSSGDNGARMINFGIDEEYIRRRLTDVLRLIETAQEMKRDIHWS